MANDKNQTNHLPTAEELVEKNSKKDLLEIAEALEVPDVKGDNNKDEIAAKIVAHWAATKPAAGEQADPNADAVEPATTQGAGDAPKEPKGFEFKASLTVSRAPENGQYFVQFSDGRESRAAANVSQVGVIASQFFAEVLA